MATILVVIAYIFGEKSMEMGLVQNDDVIHGSFTKMHREDAVFSETKRTINRQFLLKPCPETRNIIGACLGRALEKKPVKLCWFDANAAHIHDGVAKVSGKPKDISAFYRHLFSLMTRELNRLWGREGTMWSSRVGSAEVVDDESLEQQLLYGVTNMVKELRHSPIPPPHSKPYESTKVKEQ